MTQRTSRLLVLFAAALIAATMIHRSSGQPLWKMTLKAPQYTGGLKLEAYGDRIEGDLREINIINHYIGMQHIDAQAAPEMALFPIGIAVLLLFCIAAPLNKWITYAAIAATVGMPLVILADLQLWLHRYGHNLSPDAPLRQKPFTPLALGVSSIANFTTVAVPGRGLLMILGASAVLIAGLVVARRFTPRLSSFRFAAIALGAGLLAGAANAATLQQLLDAARPGHPLVIDGGTWSGPVTIRGPITVIGINGPSIDGGGRGTVVSISGDDVTFRGFVVRGSGKEMSGQHSAIFAQGNRHRIEDNVVLDAYYGIRVIEGENILVSGNSVRPCDRGTRDAGRGTSLKCAFRPGDGINIWEVRNSRVTGNTVSNSRDGIYISFTDNVAIDGNTIHDARYGIHSMFSQNATISGNTIRRNLLGAALMNSDRLVFTGNAIEDHRVGATAHGILLKDIGQLTLENNRIVFNRVGIYAEGAPQNDHQTALIRCNLFAGNEAAMALQKNVRLAATGNRFVENLSDVRPEGVGLGPNEWARDGRGNFWGDYRGFDRDGDGVGDLPYRVEAVMDELLGRNQNARAFLYTPAHTALQAAARMFPLFRPAPLLSDPAPLTRDDCATSRSRHARPTSPSRNRQIAQSRNSHGRAIQ